MPLLREQKPNDRTGFPYDAGTMHSPPRPYVTSKDGHPRNGCLVQYHYDRHTPDGRTVATSDGLDGVGSTGRTPQPSPSRAKRARGPRDVHACGRATLGRVLQTEDLGMVIVGKDFGVATPADDGAEGLLRCFGRHVILELVGKAAPRRLMARPLVEDTPNVSRERDVGEQMMSEEALAFIGIGFREAPAFGIEPDVAARHLDKPEHLQRLGDGEKIVDLHVQRRGNDRKVGLTAVRRRSDRFEQAG